MPDWLELPLLAIAWSPVLILLQGGIERELRRQSEPERAARPVLSCSLAIAAVLALLADPWLLAALAVVFGIATLMQRKT